MEPANRVGEGEPERFTFLGFTHLCGYNNRGSLVIWRQTARQRLEAKLQQVKQSLRERMHEPVAQMGEWLGRVLSGFYPVPRGAGKLGEPKPIPGEGGSLLAARVRAAQPTWATERYTDCSIARPLVTSCPTGASLSQRTL